MIYYAFTLSLEKTLIKHNNNVIDYTDILYFNNNHIIVTFYCIVVCYFNDGYFRYIYVFALFILAKMI